MTSGSENPISNGSGTARGNVVELRPGAVSARQMIDEALLEYIGCLCITAHEKGSEAAHNEALGMLKAAVYRIRTTSGYDSIQHYLQEAVLENERHRQASRKLLQEHRL